MRTTYRLAVVREEIEPLLRMYYQLVARGTLESVRTTGKSSEYVVTVHGAKNKLTAIPDFQATGVPAL